MKIKSATWFIVSAALTMAGCRVSPIMNISAAPIVAVKQVNLKDVEAAITRAGTQLGWRITLVRPGLAEGVLLLRDHKAVVDITYDTKTYNIQYKDSTNLNYDGTNIHSNYNGWIQNLDKGIKTQLTLL